VRKPNPVVPKGWRTVAAVVLTPTRLTINDRPRILNNNRNPATLRRTHRNRRPVLDRCLNLLVTVAIRLLLNHMALRKCKTRHTDRPILNRRIRNPPRNTVNNNNRTLPLLTNPRFQLLHKPLKVELVVLPEALLVVLLAGGSGL
jgi:hypothetical protein